MVHDMAHLSCLEAQTKHGMYYTNKRSCRLHNWAFSGLCIINLLLQINLLFNKLTVAIL